MPDLDGYRQLNERSGDGLTVSWFWRSIGGNDEHVIAVEDVRLNESFQSDPLHSFEDARHRYVHPMSSIVGIRVDGSEAREPIPAQVAIQSKLATAELPPADQSDLDSIPETTSEPDQPNEPDTPGAPDWL